MVFSTPDLPTSIKDFAEVYYDITAQGPDERGQEGTGMMMKSDNGQRYQLFSASGCGNHRIDA